MKNAESGEMTEHFICACNLEPIDGKTAFLSELKDIMDKYHARFEVDFSSQTTHLIIGDKRYPYLAPKWIEDGSGKE